MGKPFQTLSIYEIEQLNKHAVINFGGLFSPETGNFHNRESLEYILEACIFPIFGESRYKTIYEKISAIVHTIICNHVFHDGNKRTGLAVTIALLTMNGYSFVPTKEDEDFFVRIASEQLSIEEISAWLQQRSRLLPIK